jgi:glycosyltransferase involved in cell wall biosynthesis
LSLKLRRCRPDFAVVSQGGSYDGICPVNLPDICRAARVPYVIICQKSSETDWPHDSLRRVYANAYRGARRVYFVSEHNRRITEQQLGQRIDRAEVVRNPTLVNTSGPLPWPSCGEGLLRLACVGRMWPMEKGQDVLLNVLARDRWRSRALEVDFYGEGPMEQGLRDLARFLGLSNVRFHGQVPDITAVWRDHHALVLPSRAEGLALAQVEAMQCGRVPIVAAAGGTRELVDDGVEGFVAGAATTDEVDAALERAWVRRHEWEAIGRRAAERVARNVPADPCAVFADRLERLHSEVVRRVPRS